MSPISASRSRARSCIPRRWNGRPRAARARAGWPGNTCRIWPAGWACGWRIANSEWRMANGEWSCSPFATRYSLFATRDLPLRPVEERHRIERGGAFADLEMQLRRGDVAGLPGARDHLPALDLVAALDRQLLGVRIGGDVAVRMAHQDEIAVALELV